MFKIECNVMQLHPSASDSNAAVSGHTTVNKHDDDHAIDTRAYIGLQLFKMIKMHTMQKSLQ